VPEQFVQVLVARMGSRWRFANRRPEGSQGSESRLRRDEGSPRVRVPWVPYLISGMA